MFDLRDLHSHGSANSARRFKALMTELRAEELVAAYEESARAAPRRHARGKDYFVVHTGRPSGGPDSNRREEHLAIAIYNRFRNAERLVLPDGRTLRMLDYQLPLKARQDDKRLGKVDLFAVDGDNRPVVIELKVDSPRAESFNDTPLRGFLEALTYASIVEANISDISTELRERHAIDLKAVRPDIVVLAPSDYWGQLEAKRVIVGWRPIAEQLFGQIAAALQINVDLLALRGGTFSMGSKDLEPMLLGPCTTESILSIGGRASASPSDSAIGEPPKNANTSGSYLPLLRQGFWRYVDHKFQAQLDVFDRLDRRDTRPPVFLRERASLNLLYPPNSEDHVREQIIAAIRPRDRHQHFASMSSSQALAQSVFAGLAATGHLHCLAGLQDEDGLPVFFDDPTDMQMTLEHTVRHLREPRPTSIDVWFNGRTRVAVECKLTEQDIGKCSRPLLRTNDANYATDHCDGTYTRQRGRTSRCTLTEIGVAYWEHIPRLFTWDGERDLTPCPVNGTYQLVRNVLAACCLPDGSVDTNSSHVALVYDDRNPSFVDGGEGVRSYREVKSALRDPRRLRRCSWQRLVGHIRARPEVAWLTDALALKYGIR